MLTGESEPVSCAVKYTDKNYLETANLIFLGSHVVEGKARGVVVATGNRTTMGKITLLASATSVFLSLIFIILSFLLMKCVGSIEIAKANNTFCAYYCNPFDRNGYFVHCCLGCLVEEILS